MDKIFITGLREECIVGVWEWERQCQTSQWCSTSKWRSTFAKPRRANDQNTIDYKKVSKRLQSFIGASQFQLVETLTETCGGNQSLRNFRCRG